MIAAPVQFVGTCVELRERDLNSYDDSSRDIGYNTFARRVGIETVREWEEALGYNRHLRLKNDWHVTYSRGKWKGLPAVCMMWSSIHHIWTIQPN